MDERTEDLIRMRAFELSQDPSRRHLSDLDNWLDAERAILGGLHEDEQRYDAASDVTMSTIATAASDNRLASTASTAKSTDTTPATGKLRRAS